MVSVFSEITVPATGGTGSFSSKPLDTAPQIGAKTIRPIVIDIEGYKKRRNESLQALAWRMAEQVKAQRMPFALEPMPAFDRRIIHLTLADHPDVTTQSSGEGESRRVVIIPKEQFR